MDVPDDGEGGVFDYTPILKDPIVEVLDNEPDCLPADRILDLILPDDDEAKEWLATWNHLDTPRTILYNDWRWKRLDNYYSRLSVLKTVLEKLVSEMVQLKFDSKTMVLDREQMDLGRGEEPCYHLKELEHVKQAVDL